MAQKIGHLGPKIQYMYYGGLGNPTDEDIDFIR